MSDFVLQISGTRGAITLEPVGVIDGNGAQTLVEAVGSLRSDRAALLEINLDRITGYTDEAWRVLAANGLPVEVLAAAS